MFLLFMFVCIVIFLALWKADHITVVIIYHQLYKHQSMFSQLCEIVAGLRWPGCLKEDDLASSQCFCSCLCVQLFQHI